MLLTIGCLILGVAAVAAGSVFHTPHFEEAAIGALEAPLLKTWSALGGFTTLRVHGDEGKDVLSIQKALATDPELHFIATPNGYFGDGTEAAIRAFQTEYHLPVTGAIDAPTLTTLNQAFFGQFCPAPVVSYPDLSLARVTKTAGLPADYIPPNLVAMTGQVRTVGIQCVTRDTAQALDAMFTAALKDGVVLAVSSGFRKPDIQELTHQFWIAAEGEENAERDSATPYHSEHQLGTAVDLCGSTDEFAGVQEGFGETPEGVWLSMHAWEYGFNESYPGDSDDEYMKEPWHWRFVGGELARTLHAQGVSYNEYSYTMRHSAAVAGSVEAVNEFLLSNKRLF